MHIPILIEAVADGRYRARAGEPFALVAEGDTREAARQALQRLVAERLSNGVEIGTIEVSNGKAVGGFTIPADDRWKTDSSFAELQREIEALRRTEDEEARRQEQGEPERHSTHFHVAAWKKLV